MRDACAYADLIAHLDKRVPLLHPVWRRLWKVALIYALMRPD